MFDSYFVSGFKVIYEQGLGLIRLRHMKSYAGLLQSGFMFFMQLVVLFTRPSIGTLHGVPTWTNGRCKQLKKIICISVLFSLDFGDEPDQ